MASPFIGSITIFAGTFAPQYYAFCNGQTLSIQQNSALYAILGNIYGGDGRTTFALPDLRGCVPIQPGQGPGLTNYYLGQLVGEENHSLTVSELPAHNHVVQAAPATTGTPGAQTLLGDGTNLASYVGSAANESMGSAGIGAAGSNAPHANLQPSLLLNYIIALQGIFPSRS